jgi:hypothetical protein
MDLGLKGKTVLVLCGGGGLGRAIASALARDWCMPRDTKPEGSGTGAVNYAPPLLGN